MTYSLCGDKLLFDPFSRQTKQQFYRFSCYCLGGKVKSGAIALMTKGKVAFLPFKIYIFFRIPVSGMISFIF